MRPPAAMPPRPCLVSGRRIAGAAVRRTCGWWGEDACATSRWRWASRGRWGSKPAAGCPSLLARARADERCAVRPTISRSNRCTRPACRAPAGAGNHRGLAIQLSAQVAVAPFCARVMISSASAWGSSTLGIFSRLAPPAVSIERSPTFHRRCTSLWSTRTSCTLES